MTGLRYLFVHLAWSDEARDWNEGLVERHRARGTDIRAFCSVPRPPGPRFAFPRLDALWRRRDNEVVRLRDRLLEAAADRDVLVNFNGANIHPEWLPGLPTVNVYVCWDDPEASPHLSQPVAPYFDCAFTGNAACVPLYRSWGIERCDYLPFACYENECDRGLTREAILRGARDLDVVFLGERVSTYRVERLELLRAAFPQALMRGRGWPEGFLPAQEKLPTYAQAKIGWNVHNSVGPVNLRTFALPANGVLQICDNKCRLGQVFHLGREVVGFDTIEECIDQTRYYLDHDRERREIAAAGFERVRRDYTEERQLEAIARVAAPLVEAKRAGRLATPVYPPSTATRAPSWVWLAAKRALRRAASRAGLEVHRSSAPAVSGVLPVRPAVTRPLSAETRGPAREKESLGSREPPETVALAWAAAGLVGPARRIADLSATAFFADEAAADPDREVFRAESDGGAGAGTGRRGPRPNVRFVDHQLTAADGPFDLAAAIQALEHVADYPAFLRVLCSLAPRALVTTPNREGGSAACPEPPSSGYRREWTPGEFYWVLRCFYERVELFGMPNRCVPWLVPVGARDGLTPLVARCERPRDGSERWRQPLEGG